MINAEDARRGFKYLAWKHGSEHAQNGHEVTTVLPHCLADRLRINCSCGGSWDMDAKHFGEVENFGEAVRVLHPPECVKTEAGDCTCKAPDTPVLEQVSGAFVKERQR